MEVNRIVTKINETHFEYLKKQHVMLDIFEREVSQFIPNISVNARWTQNGITVAGGNGQGIEFNQLSTPKGIDVDDNQTVYVADYINSRIVAWKYGATSGQVVAGGNGYGRKANQLSFPTEVIVDKESDSLIICDRGNDQVVRWPRPNGVNGETIISNVCCQGLATDDEGYLYVADEVANEVRRWRVGDTSGTLVAGGNGGGSRLDQLYGPGYIFVDEDHSVYVSDQYNGRVMKWMKGAKTGTVVAGGQSEGSGLTKLSFPQGVVVDQLGTVYIVDCVHDRVMRWPKGATQGSVVVGENGQGKQSNQFYLPDDIFFDRQGNLYVVDSLNYRVQRFDVDSSSNS